MESLAKQMAAYDEQQTEYVSRIATTTRDIHVARREIQKLNAQAVHVAIPEAPVLEDVDLDNPNDIDAEEVQLRAEVNDLLQECPKAASTAQAIEIPSEENDGMQRQTKRQRSKDAAGAEDLSGFAGK